MDSPTKKSKKCPSKIELLEKLNSHKKKLLDEVKNKTYELQSSIENTLKKLNSYEYKKSCESMGDYLSIIQKLNNDFNDLEDMSNDFVENICQLRVKSVTVKDLINLPDENESKLSPIIGSSPLIRNPSKSQQLQNGNFKQMDDNSPMSFVIDDDRNGRLLITPNNDTNEKVVISSGSDDQDNEREETSDRNDYDKLIKSIGRKLDTISKVACESEEEREASEKSPESPSPMQIKKKLYKY
ncbi:protein FAM50 homolog [Microplitis mediator]|uniref:protein FAM50 homolog n=1 Tax=Microplitis mediator TaxID=375433 RepID=UPI0025550955|nr:protein FAM50 homolog [Microplitis mediator]